MQKMAFTLINNTFLLMIRDMLLQPLLQYQTL